MPKLLKEKLGKDERVKYPMREISNVFQKIGMIEKENGRLRRIEIRGMRENEDLVFGKARKEKREDSEQQTPTVKSDSSENVINSLGW